MPNFWRASVSKWSHRCHAICATMSNINAATASSTARSVGSSGSMPSVTAVDPELPLHLVYNPQGPSLPPAQAALEADYKRVLGEQHGVVFNKLYVLANMPIQRFGSMLIITRRIRKLSGSAARRPSRRQSRRRDVSQPAVGGLARLCLRLRLQSDARHANGARSKQTRPFDRSARSTRSTATRSALRGIVTAARRDKVRAAAAH